MHSQAEEHIDQEVCWALLERVASSSHLRRASRLRELLLYVGQRSIREGRDHVPELEIGVNLFGRPDTYDNANDSIVRTTISDLRKRIDAYFATEGRDEPIIMEIPRGAYVPVFFSRKAQPAQPEVLQLESASASSPVTKPARAAGFSPMRWIAVAVIAIFSVACFGFWRENRAAQRSLHPYRYRPAVASLWSNMLNSDRDTDIVTEDSSFLLVQIFSKQTISLSDYINKTYTGIPSITSLDPETRNHLLLVSQKALGKASDFRLGMHIKGLDPKNPHLRFYNAREYAPRLLERDNVILLGTPTSNPWVRWFETSLNFSAKSQPPGTDPIINRSPKPGEKEVYFSTDRAVAYCAIAFLPKPDKTGDMLLIQGSTSEATEAGGNFLLSENDLAAFEKQLHVNSLPYFEILLTVSQVLGSPVTSKIEAYRVYPRPH